jgi:hypothetical protein
MDELRQATAEVVRGARHVRIRDDAIAAYAASLPLGCGEDRDPPGPAGDREGAALHWLALDAINFGSGWFPTLRKRDGLSGYRTIAAGFADWCAAEGAPDPRRLTALTVEQVAGICGQDPFHELMGLYTASLRDLGAHLLAGFGGRATALVDAAGGSAVALATHLGGWACFADRSRYRMGDRELSLPFLKRAQIVACDLERAGVVRWRDTAGLTMFADNLVPHVLRLDGVLDVDPDLVARIEREELIEHGSPEEVELRACAVQAVERIVAARRESGPARPVTAAAVDGVLWERGAGAAYKAVPRPRCRCTAY